MEDFSPYNFLRNTELARITRVGDSEYLDMTLERGCWSTSVANGCGVYGRMPMNNIVQVRSTPRPFTLPLPCSEPVRSARPPATLHVPLALAHGKRSCAAATRSAALLLSLTATAPCR